MRALVKAAAYESTCSLFYRQRAEVAARHILKMFPRRFGDLMGDALGEPVHSVQARQPVLEPTYRLQQMVPRELLACYPGTEHVICWERPHRLDQLWRIWRPPSGRRDQLLIGGALPDASTSAGTSVKRRDPARPRQERLPAAAESLKARRYPGSRLQFIERGTLTHWRRAGGRHGLDQYSTISAAMNV